MIIGGWIILNHSPSERKERKKQVRGSWLRAMMCAFTGLSRLSTVPRCRSFYLLLNRKERFAGWSRESVDRQARDVCARWDDSARVCTQTCTSPCPRQFTQYACHYYFSFFLLTNISSSLSSPLEILRAQKSPSFCTTVVLYYFFDKKNRACNSPTTRGEYRAPGRTRFQILRGLFFFLAQTS